MQGILQEFNIEEQRAITEWTWPVFYCGSFVSFRQCFTKKENRAIFLKPEGEGGGGRGEGGGGGGGGGKGNALCCRVISLASEEYWPGLQYFLEACFAKQPFVSQNNGVIEATLATARRSDTNKKATL